MSSAASHSSPRNRRYKSALACVTCRRRKVKCDGLRPVCGRCQTKRELRESCTYIAASSRRRDHRLSSAVASPQLPTPTTSVQRDSERLDVVGTPDAHSSAVNPGEFSSEVRAAVDDRLGIPPSKKRCPIPLTDSPLFGPLCLPEIVDGAVNPADNVLPPRRHADHLVNLYWQRLDPLEPLLDRNSFWAAYQALFDGREMECSEQTFLCMLNLIFALSTQLQESTPSEQRNSASKTFFLRAWHLLRPGIVLWQASSLEDVQCLVLLTKYLQCTRNLQHTWMALGSAVRTALSIGLQLAGKHLSGSQRENELRRDVWQQCVFMDRCLSWSLGRPSTVPSVPFFSFDSHQNPRYLQGSNADTTASVSETMQEVAYLTGYIGLSQILTNSNSVESLGLAAVTQGEPNVIMQIDMHLTELENRLPPTLFTASSDESTSLFDRRLLLLRLRLSYLRIMLLRPFMARFCLPHLRRHEDPISAEPGPGDSIGQKCATLCVETAQKVIHLIRECSQPGKRGLMPWWYRIFFLYIAMQHLITAMLRPDFFATVVREPWNTAVSVLRAHDHLSLSVGKCLNSFQMMWQRVNDIHSPPTHNALPPLTDYNNTMTLPDVFQHLGFDAQIPLFGLDDSTWLDSVDWAMNSL